MHRNLFQTQLKYHHYRVYLHSLLPLPIQGLLVVQNIEDHLLTLQYIDGEFIECVVLYDLKIIIHINGEFRTDKIF